VVKPIAMVLKSGDRRLRGATLLVANIVRVITFG